jgi:hypothetical protein
MEEYEWNELVYNLKFSFEPVIGEISIYIEMRHKLLSLITTRME